MLFAATLLLRRTIKTYMSNPSKTAPIRLATTAAAIDPVLALEPEEFPPTGCGVDEGEEAEELEGSEEGKLDGSSLVASTLDGFGMVVVEEPTVLVVIIDVGRGILDEVVLASVTVEAEAGTLVDEGSIESDSVALALGTGTPDSSSSLSSDALDSESSPSSTSSNSNSTFSSWSPPLRTSPSNPMSPPVLSHSSRRTRRIGSAGIVL